LGQQGLVGDHRLAGRVKQALQRGELRMQALLEGGGVFLGQGIGRVQLDL